MAHSASERGQHRPVDVVVEASLEHVLSCADLHRAGSRVGDRDRQRGRAANPGSASGGGGGVFGVSAGSGLPSFFAKYVSMTCFAIGAPRYPCSSCSPKMTPAISGLSFGAKKTNQPWSRRSRSVVPRAACRPWFEMTCAVPGLARDVASGNPRAAAGARRVDDHPQPVVQRRERLRAGTPPCRPPPPA